MLFLTPGLVFKVDNDYFVITYAWSSFCDTKNIMTGEERMISHYNLRNKYPLVGQNFRFKDNYDIGNWLSRIA